MAERYVVVPIYIFDLTQLLCFHFMLGYGNKFCYSMCEVLFLITT